MIETITTSAPKIKMDGSGNFILSENDPFPQPLLFITSRLLKIILNGLASKYSTKITIHELVSSTSNYISPVGRAVFFVIMKKNFEDFLPDLSRLFPFTDDYHNSLPYKMYEYEQDSRYQPFLQYVRSSFNTESTTNEEVVGAHESLMLIHKNRELKHFNVLRKLPVQEMVEILFKYLATEDGGDLSQEIICSKSRHRPLVWARMWISAILKEGHGSKITSGRIGKIVGRDHATVLRYYKEHLKWLDDSHEYAYCFYELRSMVVNQIGQNLTVEKFLEIADKNGIQLKPNGQEFIDFIFANATFSSDILISFLRSRGVEKIKV